MEISLENRMLFAIQSKDLQQVSELLSKGANPNKTVCNGRTCLAEAAFRGLTDIAKLLIAESHSDIRRENKIEKEAREKEAREKEKEKKKKRRYIRPLLKKIDMESLNRSYPTEKPGMQAALEKISKSIYNLGHEFGPNSKNNTVPLSFLSKFEWDENLGYETMNADYTEVDYALTTLDSWYASILEITKDAIVAASDLTCGIDQEDAFNKSPLSYACVKNHFDVFKALVDAGCDINTPCTATGMTALHIACTETRMEFINVLLAANCDVNVRTPKKTTALHIAVTRSLKMTIMLYEHGAVLESKDEKNRTPMFMAAEGGRSDTIYYLFKRGADLNPEDSDGHTPLCLAVMKGHRHTVDMLIKDGARIKHHQCLMHSSVTKKNETMISILLGHGCGIDDRNEDGDTPLLVSMALYRPIPQLTFLLENGADVNAFNIHTGRTVLHIAVERIMEPELFEFTLNVFMDYNFDINKNPSVRETPLNRAILRKSDIHAMQIIRYGADVNICRVHADIFDNLMLVSKRITYTLADMLIKAGHKKTKLQLDQDSTNLEKWIVESYKSPLSLENICRIRIRNMRNKINVRDFVRALPIPIPLKKFLMMEEFVYNAIHFIV